MEFREIQSPAPKLAAILRRSRSRSSVHPPSLHPPSFYKHTYSRYIPSRRISKAELLTEGSLRPLFPQRIFNTCCDRVLDAPGISHNSRANILSWDVNLAVALCSQLFIWSPLSGEIKSLLEEPYRSITSVAWCKDSSRLVFCNSRSNISTYDNCTSHFERYPVSSVAYSQHYSGNMIVSGLDSGSIECLDTRGPRFRMIKKNCHSGAITGISVNDSERIASVGEDSYVRLWDLRAEKPYLTKKLGKSPLKAVKWRPMSTDSLAVGGDCIYVLTEETLKSCNATGLCGGLEWSTSGREIVGAVGRAVKVWNCEAVEVASAEEHCEDIYFLGRSREDEVVTGSLDETLRFWNLLRSS